MAWNSTETSQFLKNKIEYVGHVIEDGGIKPSPRKIHVVTHFPKPTTKKQIQSFLGLSGYFRKFINSFIGTSVI